jgi:hypothetical protein
MDKCYVCLEECNTRSPCKCRIAIHADCLIKTRQVQDNRNICSICLGTFMSASPESCAGKLYNLLRCLAVLVIAIPVTLFALVVSIEIPAFVLDVDLASLERMVLIAIVRDVRENLHICRLWRKTCYNRACVSIQGGNQGSRHETCMG